MPHSKSWLWVCSALLSVIGLTLACVGPQAVDVGPTTVVRSFDEALNAHDSDAVLNMFADGAAVQEDRFPQTSEQIRGWVGELIRQEIQLDLVAQPSISPDTTARHGTTVTWRARLDMQMYRALGHRYVPATLRAIVVDGEVAFVSIRPDATWNSWPDGTQLT